MSIAVDFPVAGAVAAQCVTTMTSVSLDVNDSGVNSVICRVFAQCLEEGGDLGPAPVNAVPGRDIAVRAGRPVHVVGDPVQDVVDVAPAECLVQTLHDLDLAVSHGFLPSGHRLADARIGRLSRASRKLCTQPASGTSWGLRDLRGLRD